jgi:hypothetical protein
MRKRNETKKELTFILTIYNIQTIFKFIKTNHHKEARSHHDFTLLIQTF